MKPIGIAPSQRSGGLSHLRAHDYFRGKRDLCMRVIADWYDEIIYVIETGTPQDQPVHVQFSDADADVLKSILPKLFQNDASSARPDGSMEVLKVVWWRHNCKAGQHSSAKVHRSIAVEPNGSITVNDLVGLAPDIIDGF